MTTIQEPHPDFFLASREGYGLEKPRACYQIKRLKGRSRDDFSLIRIVPGLVGQPYGLGDRDISTLVIAPRHIDVSLTPVSSWPVFVHVARLLIPTDQIGEQIADTDIEEVGWAELYPDLETALRSQRS